MTIYPGGKGLNQSVALAKAGSDVYHAGIVGDDGDMLLDTLTAAGVDVSLVKQVENPPSGHAVIQVSDVGENSIIVHRGANFAVDEQYIDYVLAGFGSGDILLVQNEISCLNYIIRQAHDIGMRVAFNPSPFDDSILSYPLECVDCFIVNEVELSQICGYNAGADDMIAALAKKYPNAGVMATLGNRGAVYVDGDGRTVHGVYDVDIVDTTGAGDTFTGYFLDGLARGFDINDNLRRASMAAAIAVSRPGAAQSIPCRREVETAELDYIPPEF